MATVEVRMIDHPLVREIIDAASLVVISCDYGGIGTAERASGRATVAADQLQRLQAALFRLANAPTAVVRP